MMINGSEMSISGVTMEVIECDDNVACNWRYRWIQLTPKVSKRIENGGWQWWRRWMKVVRKTNTAKKQEYENEERPILWRWMWIHVTMKALNFSVAQPSPIARSLPGSAKTRVVSTRIMCVTAETTVATVPTKESAVGWWLWQWCWCLPDYLHEGSTQQPLPRLVS